MFEPKHWVMSKYGQTTSGPAYEVRKIMLGLGNEGGNFWKMTQQIIKTQEPLKVLRLVDGVKKTNNELHIWANGANKVSYLKKKLFRILENNWS